MTELTIEDIISEMGADLDVLPPQLSSDITLCQLMAQWDCGWNTARRRGEQLARTGKWELIRVAGKNGNRLLVIRKTQNGKAKKRRD